MMQGSLFDTDHLQNVVNVASVPQRSPFRYPGGKTWFVPRLRRWLAPSVRQRSGLAPTQPGEFIEPFAGGGIISLTVAAERLAQHVTMVELDAEVAAVWQAILDPESNAWLVERILSFTLTPQTVRDALRQPPANVAEQAFLTILKNRTFHGGILAPGSGMINSGENGKGIGSRWYPATLAKRLRAILDLRDRITFVHGDGVPVIEQHRQRSDAVFFIDPPYTVPGKGKQAGKRLYTHIALDHARLFDLLGTVRGDFLMTYDDAAEVRALATRAGFEQRCIAMQTTHHAKMSELLVGRNLGWADQAGLA